MRTIPVIAIGACAGLALGGQITAPNGLASASNQANAFITITVDVSGVQFWDTQGSEFNEIIALDLGPNFFVTGLGWDLTMTSFGTSWASDAVISFQDEIFLTAAEGDDFGVTNARYASGGIIDFNEIDLDWIDLHPDGILNIEFFETFDDNPEAVDTILGDGSVLYLSVAYPTPGSAIALSLGMLCCSRRRR